EHHQHQRDHEDEGRHAAPHFLSGRRLAGGHAVDRAGLDLAEQLEAYDEDQHAQHGRTDQADEEVADRHFGHGAIDDDDEAGRDDGRERAGHGGQADRESPGVAQAFEL